MGDRRRFEELYRAHAGAVRAYARRRCEPGEADDVVADVFVVAWRRIEEVPEEPLPWLFGVARRVLANRRRGDARRAGLVARLRGEVAPVGPDDGLVGDSPVMRALRVLPEGDREVLMLVAWEGLAREQVARALGVSTGTLAVRLFRARRRLERALAELGVAGDDDEPRSVVEVTG